MEAYKYRLDDIALLDVDDKYLNRPVNYGSISSFCRVVLVLLLRAGYVLIQIQCIPTDNVHRIFIQNFVEISVSTIFYCVAGFTFAYGKTVSGVIGFGIWLHSAEEVNIDVAIYGWCVIMISGALITTILSGRVKTLSTILISIVMSVILYPMIIHMVWADGGFLRKNVVMDSRVSFKDYGGCAVIHMTGGIFSLVACMILGERIMRLKDLDGNGLTDDAPGLSVLGYFLILIGLFTTCLPSPSYEATHVPDNYIAYAAINYITSFAGGFITMCFLQKALRGGLFTYWTVLCCLQGGVAGIVTISGAPDAHNPLMSILVGALGSFLCYFFQQVIYKSSIEDYCNIVAVHMCCGILGSLICPITASADDLGFVSDGLLVGVHVCWQLIGVLIIVLFATVVALLTISCLLMCKALRNANEIRNHRRAKRLKDAVTDNEANRYDRIFYLTPDSKYLTPRTRDDASFDLLRERDQEHRGGWSKGDFFSNKSPSRESLALQVRDITLDNRQKHGRNFEDEYERFASGDHQGSTRSRQKPEANVPRRLPSGAERQSSVGNNLKQILFHPVDYTIEHCEPSTSVVFRETSKTASVAQATDVGRLHSRRRRPAVHQATTNNDIDQILPYNSFLQHQTVTPRNLKRCTPVPPGFGLLRFCAPAIQVPLHPTTVKHEQRLLPPEKVKDKCTASEERRRSTTFRPLRLHHRKNYRRSRLNVMMADASRRNILSNIMYLPIDKKRFMHFYYKPYQQRKVYRLLQLKYFFNPWLANL